MSHVHRNPRTGKEMPCKATPGNCPLEGKSSPMGGSSKGGKKFHINPRTGKASPCHASVRGCPLGGDDVHFSSMEKAQEAVQERLTAEHGLVASSRKRDMKVLVAASPEDRGAQDRGENLARRAQAQEAVREGRPLYTFNEESSRVELDPYYEDVRREKAYAHVADGTPLYALSDSGAVTYDPYYEEAMVDSGRMPRPIPLTRDGRVDTEAENARWGAAAIAERARRSARARASFDNARSAMEDGGLLLQGANRRVQDRVKPRSETSRAAWRQAFTI